MQKVRSFKPDSHQTMTLLSVAGQFRDNIWTIVDNWMLRLASEENKHSWHHLPKAKLVDNMPALLKGVSKVIEDPNNITDFEQGGLIFEAASELGVNRRSLGYEPHEVLQEQEILRNIVWLFCRKHCKTYDTSELGWRLDVALNKMTSIITESYIGAYANELTYLARRDKTTGFLNYDSFKESISEEVRRAKRYRRDCSLIMVGIDGFDEYDDTHERTITEALVYAVSTVIAQAIRSVDIPARYGPGRFAIILPETPKKRARAIAERIRKAVKTETRHEAKVRNEIKRPVMISAGIATYGESVETAEDIINLANETLLEALKPGDMVVWK